MTQHNSTYNIMKKPENKKPAPKKGELIVSRVWNSNLIFFKVQGGGQLPKTLEGGYTSMAEWDKAKTLYLKTVKRPVKEKRVVKDAPVPPTSPVLKDKVEAKTAKAA